MQIKLRPYAPKPSERGTACWNLGEVAITQLEAQEILGKPHYVELEQYRTAGGTEDHWTFLMPPDMPVFFLLAVPYNQLYVHIVTEIIPDAIWTFISETFPGAQIFQRFENPFNEMTTPRDPNFYYNPTP